jgi:hypothetical protein
MVLVSLYYLFIGIPNKRAVIYQVKTTAQVIQKGNSAGSITPRLGRWRENEWVKVERVDDCRCRILMKDAERMMIGVESGLRSAAEFLNLVADFYDFERECCEL